MAITRISVRKTPTYKKKMKLLVGGGFHIAESPHFRGTYTLRCLRFWDNNIYRVYNKRHSLQLPTSNQLGKSLRISCSPNDIISFSMKHLKHSGAPGEGGGKTNNYGPYIRGERTTGGSGTYLMWLYNRRSGDHTLFDKKIRGGRTNRVNPEYWDRWMYMFKPMIKKYTVSMIYDIIDEVNHGRV